MVRSAGEKKVDTVDGEMSSCKVFDVAIVGAAATGVMAARGIAAKYQ